MSIVSSLASRLTGGFITGVGFTAAMLVVFFGASKIIPGVRANGSGASTYTSTEQVKYTPDSGLRILSHEAADTSTDLIVRGALLNDSNLTWQDVSVKIDYFDAQGKFVDQCEEWIRGKISPHSQVNFKASCGGCSKEPSRTQYSTYKIAIVDARSDEMITVTKRITNDGSGQKAEE